MTEHDPAAAASQRYTTKQTDADEAKEEFFDICAQQVLAGKDTPDTLAARTAFTAVTIRKALRARGVNALPPGPKKATAGK